MILELTSPARANKQPWLLYNNLVPWSASNTSPSSPPTFLTGKFPDVIKSLLVSLGRYNGNLPSGRSCKHRPKYKIQLTAAPKKHTDKAQT